MPSASEVKSKFEEFLTSLSESKEALDKQGREYDVAIEIETSKSDARLDALFGGFDDDAIEALQDALDSADADWSAPDFIAAMHSQNQDNNTKAKAIRDEHGSASDIYARIKEMHDEISPIIKKRQASVSRLYGRIIDEAPRLDKSAGMLKRIEGEMANDFARGYQSLAGILDYNDFAAKNDKETITSDNFPQYIKSGLWHAWNCLSQEPEIRAQRGASSCIKSRSGHFVQRDLEIYEQAVADFQKFSEAKTRIIAAQEVYADLTEYEEQILSQDEMQSRLNAKIKETLQSSKAFRTSFAEEFGEDAQEIIAAHSKAVLLGQLRENIGAQQGGVDKAIDDINEGIKKLGRVASYRDVRVDLEKIEKSIEEGTYDIELYVGQMDDRRARINSFTPERKSSIYDDGMYFNYMVLYVLLADSAQFDAGNHDMTRSLSDQFGASLPDLAALDIETYNMNTSPLSIPGVDIGHSVDVSSSLSHISAAMPSSSDYGGGYGGYDGGGYSGGYDGGGGASFGGGDGGGGF